MALPPPQNTSLQPASRDLPAAYRNPWQNLRDALEAVVADTRLRCQELWRRNGQGSLWRPSWWPIDLAPLFWPLVLALVIVLGALGIAAAPAALRRVAPVVGVSRSVVVPADENEAAELPLLQPEHEQQERFVEQGDLSADQPLPDQEITPSLDAVSAPEPETPQASVDPLTLLVQRPEADGLLIAAQVRPDQVTLVLQVGAGFDQLTAPEQQRRAVQWQQWSVDLGYDHLELRDSRAGLLARDALVGSGMIVLNESSRP